MFKSDWFPIINSFQCFLNGKYKKRYTNDLFNNVKQYFDWYFSINSDGDFLLCKENLNEYELYLKNIKKCKRSTIDYKLVALRKLEKFLVKVDHKNISENICSHTKKNKNQYNYLTKSYIKL